ncbi:MAG: permease-like cell division protein FtsX, partial [Oscillospiraceae bacterium]
NEVMVFLSDDVRNEELTALDKALRSLDNLSSVTFISKEDGLKSWMEDMGDDGTLLEWLVEDNPLQNAYRVAVADLSRMKETVGAIQAIDGVDTVSASNEVAEAVTGLKQAVSTGGIAVVAILLGVSLIIVANTIRMTVFNRRKEISIMRFVGATDSFIRLPFLSEGLLIGVISATVAFILLWLGYMAFGNWLTGSTLSWALLLLDNLVPFQEVAGRMYLIFLGAGIGVGAGGSVIFVGKYIKV